MTELFSAEEILAFEAFGQINYGQGSPLMEDLTPIKRVEVKGNVKLAVGEKFGNLQLVCQTGGGNVMYFQIKSEKQSKGVYTKPRAKFYDLTPRRVLPYGDATKKYLEEAGIDTNKFKPGASYCHGVAVKNA